MQKRILLVGIVIIALMVLIPPWIQGTSSSQDEAGIESLLHRESAGGYAFLFNPPGEGTRRSDISGPFYHDYYRLDFGRLFLQWVFIALITAAMMFYFKEWKPKA